MQDNILVVDVVYEIALFKWFFPLSFVLNNIYIQQNSMQESSASLLRKRRYLQSMLISLNIYLTWVAKPLSLGPAYRLHFLQNAIPCNFTNTVIARRIHSPSPVSRIYLVGAKQRRSPATRHISLPVSTVLEPIPAGRMNGKRNGR